MSVRASAPSVAAAEAREPVLEFAVAKAWPYRRRMAWIAGLVLVGLLVQVSTMQVLLGMPCLLAAVVLSWVVGFDNRLDRRGLQAETGWQSAPWASLVEIVELDGRISRWDRSALDVTSCLGSFVWVVTGAALALLTAVVAAEAGGDAALIVGVDGVLLLVPQWFNGMRTVHRRPDLVLKARHLFEVVRPVRDRIEAFGALKSQLRIVDDRAGVAPADARMLVLPAGAPEKAPLLQGQVVLNRVQGTPYPYFYAVVVQSGRAGLAARAKRLHAPSGVVIEVKHDGGNDVVVVRQATTRTPGYHTKPDASRRILETALGIATG